MAEQLFFTTVRIEASGANASSVGTGFIYAIETDAGTAHFLVTNKHVLEGATSIRVRMVRASAGGHPLVGQATETVVGGFSNASWVGHADDEIDVAVVPLAPVISSMAAGGQHPFFRSVSADQLATPGLIDQLDAIELVTFVGYPNGLYDTVNFLPIARRGSTATPLDVDYQGKPTFLIDASVFPGSSGSPVFLLDQGIYQARNGGAVVGGRFACLGVLAAVHVRTVNGQIVVATTPAVTFQEPIDLGIVFKASTIDETVDRLLVMAGVQRKSVLPTAAPGVLTEADQEIADQMDG